MSTQTELQEIREEAARFMRDHYDLDEVNDGKGTVRFRRGGKTVLTLTEQNERIGFLIIFGEKERAGFESARDRFSPRIMKIYDESRTYHDGKWVFFPVAEMSMLEEVKQVIVVKKKPNRKGISKA
jgi:hypothetical protein